MTQIGGATQIYICSKCGCPDLQIEKSTISLAPTQKRVSCPNCGWAGTMNETAAILTTEKVFDTKAVLNLLLYVTTKHASGPLAQALQFIGLVEKGDQDGLDNIMRAVTAGVVESAFMAAAENAANKKLLAETPVMPEVAKALDIPLVVTGPIIMAQDTARDFGIDVDALNAGAESVPFPPKMTAENVDLFHIVTGQYDPGWQEREATAMSEKDKLGNRFWEEILRDRVVPKVRSVQEQYPNAEITSIAVPEWVYYVLEAIQGVSPKLIGYPLAVSESGTFSVSFEAGPS